MFRFMLTAFLGLASASFQCLNEKGSPVDSWVIFKEPRGTDYFYYDSDGKSFELSPNSLNDTKTGALTYTTEQLWNSNVLSYGIYNDEVPGETNYSFTYGHTKGYFAFSQDLTGFLVIHSIPLFPLGPAGSKEYLGLAGNAWTYAQSALCLSVNVDTLNGIAYKFLLNRPQFYDSVFPSGLESQYGNISKLVSGKYSSAKLCASDSFSTLASMKFQLFAKTSQWNNELYSECVAPALESTLWVESWIRGSAEPPSCPTSGYNTLDIGGVSFGSDNSWSETNDHSKWAVAVDKQIVCIGDINRMTTQYSRGGGTACFQDSVLEGILQTAANTSDSC